MGSLQVERILISDCYSLRVKIFYSIKNNSNPFQLDYSHDSILNFLATAFRNLSRRNSLSGKIKFRGYHRFRVIRYIFFALKNGRSVSIPRSSLSRFRKIRHVFFPRIANWRTCNLKRYTIHVPPFRNSSLRFGEGEAKGIHGTCIVLMEF